MKIIFTLLLLALIGKIGISQTCNSLDHSFGIGGIAVGITKNGSGNAPYSRNIIVQPDNKIIQIVNSSDTNNINRFAVIRYNSNGILDSAFGTNGRVTTSIGTEYSYAGKGALQADGKIIVTGQAFSGFNWDFALVRYNSNGSLDSSFGSGGKLMTPVGLYDDYSYGLAIQPDGKIIVVGSSADSMNAQAFAVVRYNSNGSIDSTFGTKGKIISHLGPFITFIGAIFYGTYSSEYANAVAIQTDGKIVVGGQSYITSGCYDYYGSVYCNPAFAMVRYNSNGSVDSTYGNNGKVIDSVSLQYPNSLVLQTDGKIVVTGNGSQSGFITNRYKSSGSLDSSFGSSGIVVTQPGGQNNYSYSNSLLIQPDGKIVVAGSLRINNANDIAVVRYNVNGSLDNSFLNNGIRVFHIGQQGSSDAATSLAMQGNKILVGGNSFYYTNNIVNASIVVVRLQETSSVLSPIITAGGAVNFCEGASVKLSSSEKGTIQWYKNGSPVSGATDTTYVVTTSGSYTVIVSNVIGCGVSAPIVITVYNIPSKPSITYDNSPNYHFTTTPGYAGYQWYFNNTVIAGASLNTYTPTQAGSYKVKVTDNNQCSNTSDIFNLLLVSASDISVGDTRLRYYPNPANTVLYVDIPQVNGKKLIAELYDLNGRFIQKLILNQTHNEISITRLSTGLYQLVIYNGKEKVVQKVMVIK